MFKERRVQEVRFQVSKQNKKGCNVNLGAVGCSW